MIISKKSAVAAMIVSLAFSCQPGEDQTKQEPRPFQGKEVKLGQKLKNPFRVSVMREAQKSLQEGSLKPQSGSRSVSDLDIRTTTLYIRYKPKDYAQYDALMDVGSTELYDYPLDHDILVEGDYYHDPEIPVDRPTWQYTAVEFGQQLPQDIEYEILDELYVPEDDYEILENGQIAEVWQPVVYALEDEAYRLTGNTFERITDVARTKGNSWRPAGRIQLFDDALNRNMPIVGVKVRARRWFTTHTGITNSNGDFSVDGTFRRPANYSIKWERNDWDIRSGSFGQAWYNGPKQEGNWNLTISSGTSRMYAIVHQACHDYYYGNRLGLKSPPQKSFWKSALRISVWDKRNDDALGRHCKDCRFLGIWSSIRIWNNGGTCMNIYATTIHELAHASHWELRKNNWNDEIDLNNNFTEEKVKESWARGVQWALGRLRYSSYAGGPTIRPDYTQLIVDLIDPNYSSILTNENNGLWNDNVTGYTIKQIEDVLGSASTWQGLENNIRNTYENTTEGNLQALFAHWN